MTTHATGSGASGASGTSDSDSSDSGLRIAAQSSGSPVPDAPGMTFLATLTIDVEEPIEIGPTTEGTRRLIPIRGGTVSGPRLNGRVLPGGADFQLLRSPTLTELEAKYSIETDSGERLYVTNFGIRSGAAQDIAALVRGEEVDPARIYFRCTPRLLSGGPEWSWLSARVLVGSGTRLPSAVRINIWVLD